MRVKDRAKTQILGATRPAATGALSRSKDRRNRAIRESLLSSFASLGYAFLSFSDQANPKIEKVNNFSYLLKFDPDIPNSLRGIIVYKLETLQRKYGLINGFATQQVRSSRWLLFP